MRHELSIDTANFDRILSGEKTFQICSNVHDFQAADSVLLKELLPCKTPADAQLDRIGKQLFTGRELTAEIGYVTSSHLQEDYVVFSLIDVKREW